LNTKCPAGQCCSQYGWCDTSVNYCGVGCQSGFGTCQSDSTAPPPPTGIPSSPAAPTSVPAGTIITQCVKPGQFSLTYDDGPGVATSQILDTLARQQIKATFCVVGDMINQDSTNTKRALAEGHQIISHSMTHPDFATLTSAQITAELDNNAAAITRAIGVTPRYFRFPYGSSNALSLGIVKAKGYKILSWNLDSLDWQSRNVASIDALYRSTLNAASSATSSWVALNHDIVPESGVEADALITYIKSKGYTFVTASQCAGDSDSPYL
jgi:peptidoglycan/xylan/chitin deacetylase (PgdA/CDA1 family)